MSGPPVEALRCASCGRAIEDGAPACAGCGFAVRQRAAPRPIALADLGDPALLAARALLEDAGPDLGLWVVERPGNGSAASPRLIVAGTWPRGDPIVEDAIGRAVGRIGRGEPVDPAAWSELHGRIPGPSVLRHVAAVSRAPCGPGGLAPEAPAGPRLARGGELVVFEGDLPPGGLLSGCPPRARRGWLRALASRLAGLHDAGIAVVDLRAERIWCGTDGSLAVLDWSRSELLGGDVPRVPWRSETAAPETAQGRSAAIAPATDGYAWAGFAAAAGFSAAAAQIGLQALRAPEPALRLASLRDILPDLDHSERKLWRRSFASSRLRVVSDQGPVRAAHQDRWGARGLRGGLRGGRSSGCACVADGMGGGAFGAHAAEVAVRHLLSSWRAFDRAGPRPNPDALFLFDVVERAVEGANREVADFRARYRIEDTVGTTFTACVWDGPAAVMAHVGDSRCYRLASGDAVCLSEEQAIDGALTSAIDGTTYQLQVLPLRAFRDVGWLLCTDGFWARAAPEELAAIARREMTVDAVLERIRARERARLEALAVADNATAVLIDLGGRS